MPNQYYPDKSPIKYSKVVVKIISTASSRFQAVNTGQVQVAAGSSDMADAAKSSGLTIVNAKNDISGLWIADWHGKTNRALGGVRVRASGPGAYFGILGHRSGPAVPQAVVIVEHEKWNGTGVGQDAIFNGLVKDANNYIMAWTEAKGRFGIDYRIDRRLTSFCCVQAAPLKPGDRRAFVLDGNAISLWGNRGRAGPGSGPPRPRTGSTSPRLARWTAGTTPWASGATPGAKPSPGWNDGPVRDRGPAARSLSVRPTKGVPVTDTQLVRPPGRAVRADAPEGSRVNKVSLRMRLWRDYPVLLLAIPGMLVIFAFQYYPLLGNVIAFQDYQPYLGIDQSLWVGLDNFKIIVSGDPEFLSAVKNTLILTAIQTVIVFPAPIVVALVLHSLLSNRLRQLVQSITYLPHFMSWVIVVAVFQQVLGGTGMINNWLRAGGHDPLHVIGNVEVFQALLTSQVLWKDTGWATILFLAVLAQVDRALYEASAVDGAGRWRQTWHVTLPGLKPIIILLLILKLGDSLTVGFEQIILQQQAVGVDASEVLDTYVYNNGIIGGNWGVAAAVGLVKSAVALALVLTANKIAHRFGEEGVYRG